jgi:hypothetical protein
VLSDADEMRNALKKNIRVVLFFAFVDFALFIGIFSGEGIIINRDFNFPVFKENFVRYYYPLWNDMASQPNFEQITRLPVRFFLFPLDPSLSVKLIIYLAYLLASLGMYFYVSELMGEEDQDYVPICSGLFFALSLPLLQFMGEISLVYAIGVLPVLFWSSHKYRQERVFKWSLLASLALLISAGHPFLLVVNAVLFIAYNALVLKGNWKHTFLSIIIFFLLFSWYLLPYSTATLTPTQLAREPLNRGTFDYISDNGIFKILAQARDRFLYIQPVPENIVLTELWYLSLLIPLLLVCLLLLSIRRMQRSQIPIIFFFCFVYLSATLLSFGSNGLLGDIYWGLVSSTSIGWIFRSPLKFQLYQAFAFSTLLAFSLVTVRKVTNRKIPALILAIIILVGVSGYTLWYANTKDMTPVMIPQEFYQINNILDNTPDDSKVMWYPRYRELPTTWLDRPVAPFDMKSSRKDTYSTYQNYNHVAKYLYEEVYPAELKNHGFYDFLRSIGVRYIVFHNDRDLSSDEAALKDIMNILGNESILFSSNNWFLFDLSTSNPRVFLTKSVILSENTIRLSKYGAILVPDENLNKTDLSGIEYVDERNIPDSFKERNILTNPSFENETLGWSVPKSSDYWVATSGDSTDGKSSLQITANSARRGWLFIKSSEIDVTPQETYLLQASMKYTNMDGPHIKVEGYDVGQNKWRDIFFLTASHFGDSEWTQYTGYMDVPKNISKVRIVLAAGWISDPADEASFAEFDNASLLCLSELFPSEESSESTTYEEMSPTLWKVGLNVSQPSMLVFTESYDPKWFATANGKSIPSIPLYGVINGFWINQTGLLEVTIEYEPQRWFFYGSAISVTTFLACLVYITYNYSKGNGFWKRVKHVFIRNKQQQEMKVTTEDNKS